jgi:hypothetical protein
MQAISNTRKIIYILISGLLPLVFVGMHFINQSSHLSNLELALSEATELAQIKNSKEHGNKQVKALFSNVDHFYIDKQIETISLLQEETAALTALQNHGFHADEEQIKKRLQFLTNGQNKISFVEGSVKTYQSFQETTESLAHPVEVTLEDLKTILSRIEGSSIGDSALAQDPANPISCPHLIITECKLEKKKGLTQEVFSLDLKVLKREYVK